MSDYEDDTDDADEPLTAEEQAEALAWVRDDAFAMGRERGRDEGRLEVLKSIASENGTTGIVLAFLQKAFNPNQPRDHGKFSTTGGAKDGTSETGNNEGLRDGSAGSESGQTKHESVAIANPDARAESLAARIAEVPTHVATKVKDWLSRRYAKLAARYGETGAKAILGAMVLLAPAPIPGSSLIPIAMAEAVLAIRRAVKSGIEKAMPTLDDAHIQALAMDALHELWEEMGEQLEPTETEDGAGDTTGDSRVGTGRADSVGGDGTATPPVASVGESPPVAVAQPELELLYHAAGYVQDCHADGTDPDDVLQRLYDLEPDELEAIAGDGTVEKAWSEESHPRGDDGRFVSAGEIRIATRDPKKAEELRASVTNPDERKKLDALLETKKPLGGVERANQATAELYGAGMLGTGDAPPTARLHHEEGKEQAHVFRGHLVSLIKQGDAEGVAAFGEKMSKQAAKHWQEAKDKALAQFRADYPDGSPNPFGNEEDVIAAAFDHAAQQTRSAYEKMASQAYDYARLMDESDESDLEKHERQYRRDFESAYHDALHAYTEQQGKVWDAIERVRDELGGKDKGYKLGRYFKAWQAEQHPRGKDGRFIDKHEIEAAKTDPAKAKELREQVKPEDAGKLEDALAGKTDLRNKRETARDESRQKRETVQASRTEAKRLADKLQQLQGDATADDYRALIPHLSTLTHAELSYLRTMLSTQGASFGGETRLEERRKRLLDWARGQAEGVEKPAEQVAEAVAPVAKEPWQMTGEEYAASKKGEKVDRGERGFRYYSRRGQLDADHYRAVAIAIQLGKPVPREVWVPYRGMLERDGNREILRELDAKYTAIQPPPPATPGDAAPPAKEATPPPEAAKPAAKKPRAAKPKTGIAAVKDMAKKEKDAAAKDWLESALFNAKKGDDADLAKTLGTSIEESGTEAGSGKHITRPIPPAAVEAGRRALQALGAEERGEVGAGTFDARYHQPVPGLFHGDAVNVVRPPLVLDGNVVHRGRVEAAQQNPAGFGEAGGSHPLAGLSHKEQIKRVGELGGQADSGKNRDPSQLGDITKPPPGYTQSLEDDIRGVVARHNQAVSVGSPLDKLYAAVGKKHGLSKHDFQKVIAHMHDKGVIRLSGWGKTVDELPDPQLAMILPGASRHQYYASAKNSSLAEQPDVGLGDTSLNTDHPAVQARYGSGNVAHRGGVEAVGQKLTPAAPARTAKEGGAIAAGEKVDATERALQSHLEESRTKLEDYTPEKVNALLEEILTGHSDDEVRELARRVTGRRGRTAAQARQQLLLDLSAVQRLRETQRV